MCEARKRLRTWGKGIACACAVTQGVLLDAATHLTWGVASELDDVKGIEDAGGVLELIVDGVLAVPGRGPVSRSGYRSGSLRRALLASSHARCQTFLGPGPLKRAVGCSFPRVRSTMLVSSWGPCRRRSWWCHTCSSTPSTCTPAKRAGSSDAACRHGLMWDHTVFHVVASCRARSDGGSFEAQLSDRPADRPGPQTRPGCAHPLVMFQECHRLAGGFAAYPAPYCATGTLPGPRAQGVSMTSATTRPWPCTIQPATRVPRQLVARLNIEYQRIWGASHAHRPPNRRADHNDQATRSSSM